MARVTTVMEWWKGVKKSLTPVTRNKPCVIQYWRENENFGYFSWKWKFSKSKNDWPKPKSENFQGNQT